MSEELSEVLIRRDKESLVGRYGLDRVAYLPVLMESHREALRYLSIQRREAVNAMRAEGATLSSLGELLGVTRQQVHNISNNK